MGAAAAVNAVATATRASGSIVEMKPEEFQKILHNTRDAVVVMVLPRRFRPRFQYLTSYRGLTFYTSSPGQLHMPSGTELITAKSIWVPG